VASLITPQKLRDHIEANHKRLKVERENRRQAYQEYAGRHSYKDDGVKRHLNQFARALHTLIPHAIAREAENLVETDRVDIGGEGALLALFLDRHSRQVKRSRISRLCMQDAFLGPKAICVVGEKAGSNLIKVGGKGYDRGSVFIKPIDFDDYVCDPGARCEEEMIWEGWFYDVDLDEAVESGLFEPWIKDLPLAQDCNRGQYDKLRDLSANGVSLDDRYSLIDRVTLIDVVMYDDDQSWLVTVPAEVDFDGDFLRVERYEGPDRGPLERLEFHPVNGQPHGKPPASDWRENAEAFYAIVNKYVAEAEHAKKLLLARKGAPRDEIDAITDAVDRSVIEVEDETAFTNVDIGLINKDLIAAAREVDQYSLAAAHNPDILSGGESQSDTATEYSGRAANSNTVIGDYLDTAEQFEGRLSRRVAFFGIHDPRFTKPITFMIPGSEKVQMHYDPSRRMGEYDEFTFKIVPRSMERQDANVQSKRYLQYFATILQAAQVTVQTGGLINVGGTARLFGDLLGLKRLPEVINDQAIALERALIGAQTPPNVPGSPGPTGGPKDAGPPTRSSDKPINEVRSAMPQPAMAGAA